MITFILLAVLRKLTGNAGAEAKLLERVSGGDESALSELYDLYSSLLFSLIKAVVKNDHEAEDLLQEVFIQIWEKSADYEPSKGTPYGWLTTLARNRAIDRIRSKRYKNDRVTDADTEDTILPLIEADSGNPMDAVETAQRADWIKKSLSAIPVEQKDILVKAYFGGYSQSEIAERMDLPLGTVKTRMRQGLLKLQHILAGQEGDL